MRPPAAYVLKGGCTPNSGGGTGGEKGIAGKMTTFDDREKAFEAKFARDAEMEFRVMARRNRLAGLWAAERLGLTVDEAESYARQVVQADFEEAGDDDVIRKLMGDLLKGGVETTDIELREMLGQKLAEARTQLQEG